MKIKAVVYEAEEGGYWAKVPNLPGVYTQAETLEELEANLREAIDEGGHTSIMPEASG